MINTPGRWFGGVISSPSITDTVFSTNLMFLFSRSWAKSFLSIRRYAVPNSKTSENSYLHFYLFVKTRDNYESTYWKLYINRETNQIIPDLAMLDCFSLHKLLQTS